MLNIEGPDFNIHINSPSSLEFVVDYPISIKVAAHTVTIPNKEIG